MARGDRLTVMHGHTKADGVISSDGGSCTTQYHFRSGYLKSVDWLGRKWIVGSIVGVGRCVVGFAISFFAKGVALLFWEQRGKGWSYTAERAFGEGVRGITEILTPWCVNYLDKTSSHRDYAMAYRAYADGCHYDEEKGRLVYVYAPPPRVKEVEATDSVSSSTIVDTSEVKNPD